jgi:acyl carrier protein
MQELQTKIRAVLDEHARLTCPVANLSADDDLYNAGLTSHANVQVMLALENAFDIEFPDEMLRPEVFESIASISEAVATLTEAAA